MQAKTAMQCLYLLKTKRLQNAKQNNTLHSIVLQKKPSQNYRYSTLPYYQASDLEGVNPCGRLQPKGSSNLVVGSGRAEIEEETAKKTHQNSKKRKTPKTAP
jgi:hypothetical protein